MHRLSLVLPLALAACVSVTTTSVPRPAIQTLPAARTCAADPGLLVEQDALIAEINRERGKAGLQPVHIHPVLASAAHGHACDTIQRSGLSHEGSDGTRPGQRALRAGYDYRAVYENLGLGFHSAAQAMFYWMRSPGHRDNVLAARATDAGLGLAVTPSGQRAWVLMMGTTR